MQTYLLFKKIVLILHSIYFMKKDFKQGQAQNWIIDHNFRIKIQDMPRGQHEENYWHYNIICKTKFKPDSFTVKIFPNGIHMVFGEHI